MFSDSKLPKNGSEVLVERQVGEKLGMSILSADGGSPPVTVKALVAGGAVDRTGRVSVGDVILGVNGSSTAAMDYDGVLGLLKACGATFSLTVASPPTVEGGGTAADPGSVLGPEPELLAGGAPKVETEEKRKHLRYLAQGPPSLASPEVDMSIQYERVPGCKYWSLLLGFSIVVMISGVVFGIYALTTPQSVGKFDPRFWGLLTLAALEYVHARRLFFLPVLPAESLNGWGPAAYPTCWFLVHTTTVIIFGSVGWEQSNLLKHEGNETLFAGGIFLLFFSSFVIIAQASVYFRHARPYLIIDAILALVCFLMNVSLYYTQSDNDDDEHDDDAPSDRNHRTFFVMCLFVMILHVPLVIIFARVNSTYDPLNMPDGEINGDNDDDDALLVVPPPAGMQSRSPGSPSRSLYSN